MPIFRAVEFPGLCSRSARHGAADPHKARSWGNGSINVRFQLPTLYRARELSVGTASKSVTARAVTCARMLAGDARSQRCVSKWHQWADARRRAAERSRQGSCIGVRRCRRKAAMCRLHRIDVRAERNAASVGFTVMPGAPVADRLNVRYRCSAEPTAGWTDSAAV